MQGLGSCTCHIYVYVNIDMCICIILHYIYINIYTYIHTYINAYIHTGPWKLHLLRRYLVQQICVYTYICVCNVIVHIHICTHYIHICIQHTYIHMHRAFEVAPLVYMHHITYIHAYIQTYIHTGPWKLHLLPRYHVLQTEL